MSNLDAEPAHVCLASADTHPTLSAAWRLIDRAADYTSFSQVVGRQQDKHHLTAASAKVWGHSFWHLNKHHRENEKYMSISTQICSFLFIGVCVFGWVGGGGLPRCCWQLSLLLGFCIIRRFCLLSKSAKTARLHGWGRETHWTHGFWWEEGALWCSSFMQARSTLWYFISWVFFFLFNVKTFEHTSSALSWEVCFFSRCRFLPHARQRL